ncbi:hypothetical protein COU58_02120 [Candidatus Pacearchaeota archaeon CG10_big_fil_rev_8_21_14_0_10_32_42]|nr:MAG: hypothetical protein COU58_02120 [Candidatus Pacearchaeota archaeon CG10_big_fil_rev_8_21_14_0_10_32_42]
MNKLEKILLILIIILALIWIFPKLNFTGKAVLNKYAYTKAICNETNYCEDYYIECEDKNIVGFTTTGFAIQSKDLPENQKENLCK